MANSSLRRCRGQLLTACSPFLKERLFGLSNPQGNHGESIKEAHFHLDNTPVSLVVTVYCDLFPADQILDRR